MKFDSHLVAWHLWRSFAHRLFISLLLVFPVFNLGLAVPGFAASSKQQRILIKGEIIDSWCQISGIMGPALGTAHHQCAIWCAVGGIPSGIMGDDGTVYIILKSDAGGQNVANPGLLDIQSNHVTAQADMIEKDGVKYLFIDAVIANDGTTKITHPALGILPFGE